VGAEPTVGARNSVVDSAAVAGAASVSDAAESPASDGATAVAGESATGALLAGALSATAGNTRSTIRAAAAHMWARRRGRNIGSILGPTAASVERVRRTLPPAPRR
jgi:hypothetical protein